jgi:hypothetical protein
VGGIQQGQGFVQQAERRLLHEQAGDQDQLLLAAGQAVEGAVGQVGPPPAGPARRGRRPDRRAQDGKTSGGGAIGPSAVRCRAEKPALTAPGGGSHAARAPRRSPAPATGGSRPASVFSSVVFPAPLGPITATISPGETLEIQQQADAKSFAASRGTSGDQLPRGAGRS